MDYAEWCTRDLSLVRCVLVLTDIHKQFSSNRFIRFDAGLTGAGQVVSVSDTGLDMNNCYFLDATGTVFETTRGSGVSTIIMQFNL